MGGAAEGLGARAMGERVVTNWPLIVHLRADPYEMAPHEADMGYLRWSGTRCGSSFRSRRS